MFSFNRFLEQFKILIYQNYKRHGIFLLIFMLYMVYVHIKFFFNPAEPVDYPFNNFTFFVSLAAVFFSIDTFSKLRSSTSSGINYIMLPATTFEKFFSAWIYSTIATFIVFLFAYMFTNVFSIIIGNSLSQVTLSMYFPNPEKIWDSLKDMFFFQSLYFLGALIFKKNPFAKTTLVIFGFLVLVSLISSIIIGSSLKGSSGFFNNNFNFTFNGSMSDYTINGVPMDIFFENVKNIIIVCLYILPFACWTGAYFRLKNIQI